MKAAKSNHRSVKRQAKPEEPRRARVRLTIKHMHELASGLTIPVRLRLSNGEEQIIELGFQPDAK